MLFYNDFEIEQAVQRYQSHPVLGKAARMLAAVANDANQNSDGWAHWPLPCRACKQLMTLLTNGAATEAEYRKALAPIRAFYTRVKARAPNYPAFPQE